MTDKDIYENRLSILRKKLSDATEFNPVTRQYIVSLFHLKGKDPDRQARKMIQELRNRGIYVCSNSVKGGYWIAKTPAEKRKFDKWYGSYGGKCFKSMSAMHRGETPKTNERQVSFNEILP